MKVSARFKKIEEIKELFPKDFLVVGVGVTAFPRSGLAYLLPNYKILSLLETSDLGAIRKKCEVVSVEKDLGGKFPEKYNTSGILEIKEVRDFLQGTVPCKLFLYKASTVTDRIVKDFSLKLLSAAGHIRKVFENKKEFRVDAVKAGLRIPKGATLLIKDLTDAKWEEFKEELGDLPAQAGRLVFQLTDYTIGGGLGTFFIDNKEDLKEFREFVERRGIHPLNNNKQVKGRGYSPSTAINRNSQGRVLEFVNVTERIEGRQASIAGCATFYGTVACVLQNQIMDQPELAALAGRSGVWLGQDWHVRFSEKAQLLAEKQVKKWGEYIYKKGYKGIFGLDLIVTNEDEVYAIECNSRYTGAFPVLTMAQLVNKEMPIDVWHLLEWFPTRNRDKLGVEYEMDIDEVQKVYRQPKKGAFVLLHNLERKFVTPTRTVKAGVYKTTFINRSSHRHGSLIQRSEPVVTRLTGSDVKSETLPNQPARPIQRRLIQVEYLRPGFSLLDIKNEDEFILCDRVPTEEMVLKPAERMGRLIFNRRIVTDEGELLDWTRGVVKAVYDKFELGVVSARAVS
ncbi:ATP-grasp domain-containing protein [Patescibacteria group bacterium]|nr:ATP-grasp domain-containing protein [Patescibacteria group bacterium]